MSAPTRLQQLEELLKKEPEDSFLNYAIALEHAKNGDRKKAIELIELMLKKDKTYLGAYYQLGQLYEQTGDVSSAIETYQKGIIVARQQKNNKTLGELNTAILLLED